MFDHLLELSYRDDSNKWLSIGFGEEITQVESIEVKFTQLIWSSGKSINQSSHFLISFRASAALVTSTSTVL